MADTSDRLIGTRVGDLYVPERLVDEETLGRVYDAQRVGDGARVYLKVLYPHLANNTEKFTRFQREAVAAALARHPHVLPVIDAGGTDPVRYLVYEHFPSHSLAQELRNGPVDPFRAAAIVMQAAAALTAAHAVNIVHRNINPHNILIATARGEVHARIRDFGLAHLEDDLGDLTPPGVHLGHVIHLSPEYVIQDHVGPEMDAYALGVVLYQALTGSPPFDGSPQQVLDRQLNEVVPLPSARRPGLPRWADEAVDGLTAWQPWDRWTVERAVEFLIERTGQRVEGYDHVVSDVKPPAQRKEVSSGRLAGLVLLVALGALVPNVVALAAVFTIAPRAWEEVKTRADRVFADAEPAQVEVATAPAPLPTALPPQPELEPEPEPKPYRPPPEVVKPKGRIAVVANRRVLVRVDGEPAGYTPIDLRVVVGVHRVEAAIPGRPDTMQLRVVDVDRHRTHTVTFAFGR